MMPSRLAARVLLLVVLASAAVARAQNPDAGFGRPVTAVVFLIEGKPDPAPALIALVDVKVGQPLTREVVRSSLGRIADLGRYEDNAGVETRLTETGVDVTFVLMPIHPVTRISVTGSTGVSPNTLRDLIQQRFGGVPTGVRRDAVETAARQLLNDQGYLTATVTSDVALTHNPDAATLVLRVEAGPLSLIKEAHVSGRSPISAEDVLRRTQARPGEPYKRRDLDTALTAIEDDLRGRGYYEAQAAQRATTTVDGVVVNITLDAGPRVELRVQPEGALPGRASDLIPIQREGSADIDLLEDSKRRIEVGLRAEGYVNAVARFSRETQADGLLVIAFTIDRGPRFFVDRVEWPEGMSVPAETLRKLVDISPGAVFDETRFIAGLVRVVEEYRTRGYYLVEAKPARQVVPERSTATSAFVVLYPTLVEGPRGQVAGITFTFSGAHRVPEADLRRAMQLQLGQPYIQASVAQDQVALRRTYLNSGYLSADVLVEPKIAENGRDVTVAVRVNEGPQVVVSAISVVGNDRISEKTILEELRLRVGEPLGASALTESRRRLAEMGVFRHQTVTADEQTGAVVVSVVEAPATTGSLGGGVEGGRVARAAVGGGSEDHFELAPRGFVEIGRRNLGGRNRSINFFSRVALRERRAQDDPSLDRRGFGFTEYRVTGTYRERHAWQTDSDLLVGFTSEQAVRTGFNYIRQAANAEVLHRLTDRVSLSGRYTLDVTRLFDEQFSEADRPLIDRLFPQVRLSTFSTGLSWDRRDSPLTPTRGTFVTADASAALRAVGSQVGFVRTFFQASAFRRVTPTSRTILALRGELGLARGFERTVVEVDANGQTTSRVVEDLPASQRFFAGGSTTVRGFQLDRLGVAELIRDGLSIGGNSLIILNAELRRSVGSVFGRTLTGVGFLDSGNVFPKASDLSMSRLRATAGFGVRYDLSLAPIRFDVGFKVRPQTFSGVRERGWEYHLSIGEAF